MRQKKKRSGLDTVASLLSRHVDLVAKERRTSRLTSFELEEVLEIGKGLVQIENARTVAVFRALSQRHRSPAELKELLLNLQAKDDEEDGGDVEPGDTGSRN